MNIIVEGTVGKRFPVFAEAISLCNVFFNFVFVLFCCCFFFVVVFLCVLSLFCVRD